MLREQSVTLAFRPRDRVQPVTYHLQPVTCNLPPSTFNLQLSTFNLKP
ncbi:MAG: restriction endonuclease [Moorea sp. SIOASIH]|nr:restriction endonuclease [Moorena sp. SIOASIH]NEO38662.1 restriction endonuclease [Moorena sp. SIOASIH]